MSGGSNGQKVALRTGNTLYYLHADHLNTASLTTNSTGNPIHQVRNYPFGTDRWSNGADVNPRGFTDQLPDSYIKLIDYGARWYDPYLNRFVSPDSVVPGYENPQNLNRYAYARNNPVRFTDPTGHYAFEENPDDPAVWYDKPDEYRNTLVRGVNSDSFTSWEDTQDSFLNDIPAPDIPENRTVSIGYGGVLFVAAGGNLGGSLNFDTKGNWSFMLEGGGGGYAAAGGGTGTSVMVTNAPSVHDLQGNSIHFGGQVGEGLAPGVEWVTFKGQDKQVYHGLNVTGNVALFGPWPGELHATVEHDFIPELFGIKLTGTMKPFKQETTYVYDYNR